MSTSLIIQKWFDKDLSASSGPNTYRITASAGTYTYTGQSATILKSRIVSASSGSYTYTGQAATIKRSRLVSAASGSYTYTGQAATILKSKLVSAASGSYTYTGQTATILHSRLVTASSGSYVYTGQNATITYTPSSAKYTVTADAGSYSINGQDATITYVGTSVPVTAPAETPAGRSKRRTLHIYRVKVNDEVYEFKTLAEAITFLERAKAAAAQVAREALRAATELDPKKPDLTPPKITINTRELRVAARDTSKAIEATYRQAAIDAELAMLFAMEREAENEDIALLLM